jgi:hypothetical protein
MYATALPGERELIFFLLPAQLDCIDLAKPVPSAKVKNKTPKPTLKHHRGNDGGGVEPIINWSKPQLSSQLYFGYLAIPCTHHLVHFSVFCPSKEDSARWTPLTEDTLGPQI